MSQNNEAIETNEQQRLQTENLNEINNSQNHSNQITTTSIKSNDILDFSLDFIPSFTMYLFLSLLVDNDANKSFCHQNLQIMLDTFTQIYIFFSFKAMLKLTLLASTSWMQSYAFKYSLNAIEFSLKFYLSLYYCLIIYFFTVYRTLPDDCLYNNPYPAILVSIILTLGIFDVIRHVMDILILVIGFPFMIYYFYKEPGEFINRFGIDPDVIDNWPAISCETPGECVICVDDIKIGEKIMILNCNGKHFYHEKCIKTWLKTKVRCPICRSANVF